MAEVKVGDLLECDDANCEGCRGEAVTPEEEAWAVVAIAHCLRGYDKTERDCYFRKWHKVEDKGQSPDERKVEMSEERIVQFAIVERSVDEDGSRHMRMLLPEKDDAPMPRIKTAAEGEKLVRLLLVKYHSDVLKANCVENVDVVLVPFGGPG